MWTYRRTRLVRKPWVKESQWFDHLFSLIIHLEQETLLISPSETTTSTLKTMSMVGTRMTQGGSGTTQNTSNPQQNQMFAMMDPQNPMMMMKLMMEGVSAPIMALAKAQTDSTGKRKKEQDEEEEARSRPVLVDLPGHHLKDDAHNVIDFKARELRPYNGGNQEYYWSRRLRRSAPVIDDLKLQHLAKAPINPTVIVKLHDRGGETSAKQWLSSNYSVEGKGGKIRADNDRTAGAFVLNYSLAKGPCPWEAVDAIHNYTLSSGKVTTRFFKFSFP